MKKKDYNTQLNHNIYNRIRNQIHETIIKSIGLFVPLKFNDVADILFFVRTNMFIVSTNNHFCSQHFN